MFEEESLRLLREDWPTATMLAEELYAIFNSKQKSTSEAPQTVTPTDGSTPMTLNVNADNPPGLTINKPGDSLTSFFADGGIEVTPYDVGTTTDPVTGQPVPKKKKPEPIVAVGKVTGGSGTDYQVDLFGDGPDSGATNNVSATQLQIADGETIDVGTSAIVVRVDGKYYMQVAVWEA